MKTHRDKQEEKSNMLWGDSARREFIQIIYYIIVEK